MTLQAAIHSSPTSSVYLFFKHTKSFYILVRDKRKSDSQRLKAAKWTFVFLICLSF